MNAQSEIRNPKSEIRNPMITTLDEEDAPPVSYADLDAFAKARVRDRRRPDFPEEGWDEFIKEDWIEKIEAAGFADVKIRYSGFCCQGDGASFTGRITGIALPEDLLARLRTAAQVEYAIRVLTGTAKNWDSPESIANDWEPQIYEAKIDSHDHHYCHAYTISASIDIRHNPDDLPYELARDIDNWIDEQDGLWTEKARDLSLDLYNALETAYWLEISDESLDDRLAEEDTLYTPDGEEV